MDNSTENQKAIFLSQVRSTWLQNICTLCTILPMGVIGTVLNLMSLGIFIKKSIRKISLFKYLIIISVINSIIAFSLIFTFYRTPNIFFDLSISISGRIFNSIVINDIISYFFFLSNLIEIMISIERALYFSERFQKFKTISPYMISFLILLLSLIIYMPNFLSVKMVPTDQIFIINRLTVPTDFALSNNGKKLLLVCYVIEGPIIFILLIATNVIANISYQKFNQKKDLIERANNIEMTSEGEIKKKNKIEKIDRKLLMMTSYLSLISIVTSLLVFTAHFLFFIITTLSPKTVTWLIYASGFSVALKQILAIVVYYNYKMFRKEFLSLVKKIQFLLKI